MATALLVQHRTPELPTAIAWPHEVLGLHPSRRFAAVPPPCPTPQLLEDQIIDACKRMRARCMPVIKRPTANLRVELLDQLPGREVAPLVLDHLVDLGQECPHVFPGRLQ